MAELKGWDVAAANNNDTPPDGAPEGMAPSAVNDVIRENMAVIARWKGDNDGTLDSGGSSNAYTLTPNGTYSAYSRGDTFTFEANHTNTGSATLNVSSLGAKTIKHVSGATLSANQLLSGGVYRVVYDGTDFLLENPSLIDSDGGLVLDGAPNQIGLPGLYSGNGDALVRSQLNSSVASGATTSMVVGRRFSGMVVVSVVDAANASIRSVQIYGTYFYEGDNTTIVALGTGGTGTGGARTFTPGYDDPTGAFTVTNTSGSTCAITISAYGGKAL